MKSRNVAGYVNRERRAQKLERRLRERMDKLAPLRVKAERARAEANVARAKLTGTQYAEAQRLLSIPECPPRYVYPGHDWVLNGETWRCSRCGSTRGVMKVNG